MHDTIQPLRLYFHPRSRAAMVRWMLEECGARYETIRLEFGSTMKSPEFLAINPMGKVPALAHGDTVVTESGAILAYLAELFPERQLAPACGSPLRGSYLRWMFFLAGPVDSVMTAKSQGHLAQQTPEQAVEAGYGRLADVVQTLRQAVAGKRYLCGDQFTAADVYMASCLRWGTMMGLLPDLPEFSAYGQPLVERAASLRAIELNEAEEAAQPA
ncbi:glutathione S-transferase family protein [Delftia sp. PS-11]|uniref:glutathione S-transferase family protein n=1 Tax=Delftia sp. PS-11 TaxID=2767222 RepID=UPI00245611B4|nr:glutathione S-transferase family protein [Delftia sp. PS-11]KAJ8740698.1 glutathione S-transferase family protein [Delftia sp. PS-11]